MGLAYSAYEESKFAVSRNKPNGFQKRGNGVRLVRFTVAKV